MMVTSETIAVSHGKWTCVTSSPGSNGVTFRPYLAGERTPHLNPDLRGSFTGLSLATTQADVVRAVLEGVAFSLRDALDVITPLAPLTQTLATGGGSRSDFWLQLVTDVLGVPLERPAQSQGPAYGAALLAWQGVGHTDRAAALARRGGGATFTPAVGPAGYDAALTRYRADH